MIARRAALACLVLGAPAVSAAAQSDSAAVHALWNAYLASKQGALSSNAGSPSPYWLAAEQRKWPTYDFAGYYLGDRATPDSVVIVRVRPTDSLGGAFRIRTRFKVGDAVQPPKYWTTTVYARQENGEWRLANALPITTREWRRTTVGPITYVYPPTYPYSAERAGRAVAFADSVSRMLNVPPLAPLTYYLAPTLDDVYRIIGVETGETYGPSGGFSQPVNHLLFSGIPSLGEDYRHELAHLLLAPLCCARTSYLVSEGVPTWLGGTSGSDFKGSVAKLKTFLLAHPSVTLDSVLAGELRPSESYPAAAVLVAMVVGHDGTRGVRELFGAGSSAAELQSFIESALGMSWADVNRAWRAAVFNP